MLKHIVGNPATESAGRHAAVRRIHIMRYMSVTEKPILLESLLLRGWCRGKPPALHTASSVRQAPSGSQRIFAVLHGLDDTLSAGHVTALASGQRSGYYSCVLALVGRRGVPAHQHFTVIASRNKIL